ncbi:MAG: enoyl-CoA hydratase/isomerase family protein [Deltaproteobacteria bacterium]|nr:enoyl-CoA hydratase/isomerase family protein [Deltaproteobacteria bacterium]
MSYIARVDCGSHETWCISRPERGNALGTTLARELLRAAHALRDASHKPRSLVIRATPVIKGDEATWIAGGDLKELALLRDGDEAKAYVTTMSDALQTIAALPIPVVVAIDGAAIGGGAELALAGDLRLATERSVLEFRQLKAGLATGYGSACRMVQLVGLGRTQGMLFRTESVSATEAVACGLLHEVCKDSAALDLAVTKLCADLAALDPAALAAQKRMLWHATHQDATAARTAELELFATIWRNPGHSAFLDAFASRSSERER